MNCYILQIDILLLIFNLGGRLHITETCASVTVISSKPNTKSFPSDCIPVAPFSVFSSGSRKEDSKNLLNYILRLFNHMNKKLYFLK